MASSKRLIPTRPFTTTFVFTFKPCGRVNGNSTSRRAVQPVGAAPFSLNRHIAPADRIEFDKPFLVDLKQDPGETTNVAPHNPKIVQRLLALAEGMREDLGDYDRVGRNMRFFDPIDPRPAKPPVPRTRKPRPQK